MLSTGMNMREFATSIEMPYESLRTAFKRESDLSAETLASIKRGHPDISIDWLVLGQESEVRKDQKRQLIVEADLLLVYDLLDNLKVHDGEEVKLKDVKREIVKLFHVHSKLKDDMAELRNITYRKD